MCRGVPAYLAPVPVPPRRCGRLLSLRALGCVHLNTSQLVASALTTRKLLLLHAIFSLAVLVNLLVGAAAFRMRNASCHMLLLLLAPLVARMVHVASCTSCCCWQAG